MSSIHFRRSGLYSVFLFLLVALGSCDTNRVYEDNREFADRTWVVTEEPRYVFNIRDTAARYNLYLNIRNSLDYPFSRIFVMAHLYDSTDHELMRKLLTNDLFDEKTGEPFGNSGLGDVYDHQFLVSKDLSLPFPGKFTVKLDQRMRPDTLAGIIAAGIRVERAENKAAPDRN